MQYSISKSLSTTSTTGRWNSSALRCAFVCKCCENECGFASDIDGILFLCKTCTAAISSIHFGFYSFSKANPQTRNEQMQLMENQEQAY